MDPALKEREDPIILNPAEQFGTPERLASRSELSVERRIELLHQWRFDAIAQEVAADENMTGDQPSMLARIGRAIIELGGDPSPSPSTHR